MILYTYSTSLHISLTPNCFFFCFFFQQWALTQSTISIFSSTRNVKYYSHRDQVFKMVGSYSYLMLFYFFWGGDIQSLELDKFECKKQKKEKKKDVTVALKEFESEVWVRSWTMYTYYLSRRNDVRGECIQKPFEYSPTKTWRLISLKVQNGGIKFYQKSFDLGDKKLNIKICFPQDSQNLNSDFFFFFLALALVVGVSSWPVGNFEYIQKNIQDCDSRILEEPPPPPPQPSSGSSDLDALMDFIFQIEIDQGIASWIS